ncbi:hypothetical protein [Escherichia phage e4/1c]|uniref:Uncharacterized protein n=1 Tax=Escherichia phage e4/1c TaxID=1495286 RepID=A0A023ZUS6_9CAUD|nr:hypothetical protein e41c_0013 [Escherichia phage e4/1c]AHY83163.1 hypothetical protein [Escherichia phage e4/1c]
MIRLEHTGACFIMIDGKGYVPGDFIETKVLSAGIKQLIAEGRLTLADDPKESKKIAEEIASKRKRKEPKTISEAETGNEYK